jgi:hypothetical protein
MMKFKITKIILLINKELPLAKMPVIAPDKD